MRRGRSYEMLRIVLGGEEGAENFFDLGESGGSVDIGSCACRASERAEVEGYLLSCLGIDDTESGRELVGIKSFERIDQ